MKNFTFLTTVLFLLSCNVLFGQLFPSRNKPNPDGERASLHITPYFTGGEYSFKMYSSIINGNIPDGAERLIFTTPFNLNFGLHILLKVPLNNNFTLSPFFANETYDYGTIVKPENYNGKGTEMIYKNTQYKAGATISIYF